MKSLALESVEFASKRRIIQDEYAERLMPALRAFFQDKGSNTALVNVLSTLWTEAFADESDAPANEGAWQSFVKVVEASMEKVGENPRLESIALSLANATVNSATMAAADADEEDLLLEWVTMEDPNVRALHAEVEGQTRPPGEPFTVGEHEVPYPGAPVGPPAIWINCRCVLRPTLLEDAMTAAAVVPGDEPTEHSLCLVALPAEGQDIIGVGEEQKHVTLYYAIAQNEDMIQVAHDVLAGIARDWQAPITATVSGNARLGPDKAKVATLDSAPLVALHDAILDNDTLEQGNVLTRYPTYLPHMTLSYEETFTDEVEFGTEIVFDRLAVWDDAEQTEYPLEATMAEPTTTEPDEIHSVNPEGEEASTEEEPIPTSSAVGPIPWHGVLVVEGIETGDGRRFEEGSLRNRDLPLPLTWQKISDDGHKQNVTVAKIEKLQRIGDEMHASGHFINSPEAEENIGLIGEFGRFGVSIDADDGTREYLLADDGSETEIENYLDARICGACVVHIPAFAEAWVALGPHPVLDAEEDEDVVPAEQNPEGDEDVPVDVNAAADGIALKRGPGWITNPDDTKRLHDYWTKPGEPGFIKIGWGANGSNGDFASCVRHVGEKIAKNSPEDMGYINRICAEWHHDALGIWPGESLSTEDRIAAASEIETQSAQTISLTAAARPTYNADWFANPNLTEPTPIVITDEGRVYGHVAQWETCHIGFDRCTVAPQSEVDYAFFLRGTVLTEKGEQSVGPLSIVEDTTKDGHAGPRARGLEAAAHYDNVGSAWAFVNAGEDEHGIWFAGQVRHGVDPAQVELARSVGAVSGDWRKMGGSTKELVAVLTVNTPGFSLWRPRVGFRDGEDVSLVAAGMVRPKGESDDPVRILASALADEMESREVKRQTQSKAVALKTRLITQKKTALRDRLSIKEN